MKLPDGPVVDEGFFVAHFSTVLDQRAYDRFVVGKDSATTQPCRSCTESEMPQLVDQN